MRVPVLDTHRNQLMPMTSKRARLLLKQGRARPYWNGYVHSLANVYI
ncbi:MAG: RRXRR domain-containing protein [candidate division Zixibacteria bacterium]|nr:RRXRR domain-containing protein [candidate division Zixibacteria bacterium]